MAYELQAPNHLPSTLEKLPAVRIFTAGSIEMGKATPWQDKLVKLFSDRDDIVFFNPRRADWNSSWVQDPTPGTQFHTQVSWELDHIEKADLVIFYFDPKTQSPITLLELGHCLGQDKPILVCCPDGYFRKGNVVIICERHNIKVMNTFDELATALAQF
jgi:nucleoside 2-deoxyribosyltransferase